MPKLSQTTWQLWKKNYETFEAVFWATLQVNYHSDNNGCIQSLLFDPRVVQVFVKSCLEFISSVKKEKHIDHYGKYFSCFVWIP